MKIAVLTLDFPPAVGGVQQYLGEISQRLARRHDVVVVTPVEGEEDRERALKRIVVPPSVPAFVRVLRGVRPDRVVVGHAHPRLLLSAAMTSWGKYITILHGNDYLAAQNCWHRPIFNWLLERSSPLITNSTANALRLSRLGLPQPKIIYPGADPERFRPRSTPLPFPPVLLTVGRLIPRKGIDLVLQALPSLLTSYPDLEYHIIGDGPDREKLESIVQQLGIDRAVRFMGRVSDAHLPEVYRDAHVFVMPVRTEASRHSLEGFGIVYLEAAASGLPTVAGRSGGAVEAIIDGRTGFLVPSDDAEALTSVLAYLLGDDQVRRRMGDAGRRWVEEEMNWDRAAKQMLEILEA